jgi:hypothetical protein
MSWTVRIGTLCIYRLQYRYFQKVSNHRCVSLQCPHLPLTAEVCPERNNKDAKATVWSGDGSNKNRAPSYGQPQQQQSVPVCADMCRHLAVSLSFVLANLVLFVKEVSVACCVSLQGSCATRMYANVQNACIHACLQVYTYTFMYVCMFYILCLLAYPVHWIFAHSGLCRPADKTAWDSSVWAIWVWLWLPIFLRRMATPLLCTM